MAWEPVVQQFLHGILRSYKVRYKEHAHLNLTDWSVKTISHNTLRTNLTGLKPGTRYEVQVSAFTIKDGVWSESVMAVTQRKFVFGFNFNILLCKRAKFVI